MYYYSLLAAACLVTSVSAHATFQELWINGVDQGSSCVRLPLSNNPVTDVTSKDLTCNVSPTPSNGICSVLPGDKVTVEMHQQPNDRSCATEAIGGAHASWFKVSEMGLPSSNPDYWEVLNDNCGHYTFTVPSNIKPGNYLLRAEVIALHVASSVGGAQFYMSCYQINIGGSGTVSPAGVKIPGAYSASDPGILINIYQQLNSYIIPGPSPYGTTSPTVAATAWPTTATWNTATQPTTVPTTVPGGSAPTSGGGGSSTSPTSPTSPPSSSPTSGGGTSAAWGQCGGIGWTGPTACVSGYKCSVNNPYFSQCIPA
ncbi:hypothetical protein D9757_005870 [Collybiopsis confluens]|uniref:AA9 family lytic polysaccharide monooxygenase n=1 Tax=Collybiopsis confluens TaxID=2823264 RepID=A0A8H5HNE8_9AGAR|nr:hypothetical protein D9757_005870 [Collybiopsis confluens]